MRPLNCTRPFLIWCCLVPVMIVIAALREVILKPEVGELTAHLVSTLVTVGLIFVITLLTLGWIAPANDADCWRIGLLWFFLTIGCELLASHIVFGVSWRYLLADYDLLRGRVWLLVLCGQLLSPWLAARLRRQSPSPKSRKHGGLRLPSSTDDSHSRESSSILGLNFCRRAKEFCKNGDISRSTAWHCGCTGYLVFEP